MHSCQLLVRSRILTLLFPLIKSNPLKIISKHEQAKTKKNLIEILANLLLYTNGKTKQRVLKKILKNLDSVHSFAERLKVLRKKDKGKNRDPLIQDSSILEEVHILLILLETQFCEKGPDFELGESSSRVPNLISDLQLVENSLARYKLISQNQLLIHQISALIEKLKSEKTQSKS